LKLVKNQYRDYNDCHFTEALAEKYGLQISRSSMHRMCHQGNCKSVRKQRGLTIAATESAESKLACSCRPTAATVIKIHSVLHSALEQAVKTGILSRNPVHFTQPQSLRHSSVCVQLGLGRVEAP
jgi:hypothetical protein